MQHFVKSILNTGGTGFVIEIECNLSNGLPSILIVGLGNKAIDEAKERIRSAFTASKLEFPKKRITVNLAPADVPKDSSGFDLPIAVAILVAGGQIPQAMRSTSAFIGELGLDGSVRSVRGIIGKLITGQANGISTFYVPEANMKQALLVPGISVVPVQSLRALYECLTGRVAIPALDGGHTPREDQKVQGVGYLLDDVVGQQQAKRALMIAAAGGHNIFLSGPPGTGKSMLAKTLASLLPPLSSEEMLEVTHLHSLASYSYEELMTERPFRAPHHTASQVAVIGGGARLKPGEISLSHHGVLFLDEMPEFSRSILEALRQPLEDGSVTIARARDSISLPANFILIATANPCPCGYYSSKKVCVCSPNEILKYRQKISGPIMDRIDLCVSVEHTEHTQLLHASGTEEHVNAQRLINFAREAQIQRFKKVTVLNADMTNRDIKKLARLSKEAVDILNNAATRLDVSARSYMRIIKVARTIADLESSRVIEPTHIAEALQYRSQNLTTIE